MIALHQHPGAVAYYTSGNLRSLLDLIGDAAAVEPLETHPSCVRITSEMFGCIDIPRMITTSNVRL